MIVGNHSIAPSAAYAGTGRSEALSGQQYDDLEDFGTQIDFEKPIKSIKVHWGSVIGGLEPTYNLVNGTTKTVMHGAHKGEKYHSTVDIADTERIIEVMGLHGTTHEWAGWGDQLVNLAFKIYNSTTGTIRTTETFGYGDYFNPQTRKDILVRGLFVGFAGSANNSASEVGLNQIVFYTEVTSGDGSKADPRAV